ncbi:MULTISPECIES: iron chelate ABC transporter ATP-binding protein VctC [Vibrio]|jgi:iron complex transport system ATP-binding protein|uniref:Iron complex transport system ATP-binding protein n=1 Tax=Vibrio diazotrophicus TaxID=685 RepID=A0A2J8GB51_VIBDI|nr:MULTISPECIES: iron chelate ABC transporter ATP-binding protein VctC [Vibrio]MCF7361806.1 iron chelate ABC transporter ATP-binding protein VctC [Vibrio sp. A1-b2]PNH83246.1 siderophore ABC transporter ATP-binding protein [Vibrio diazotrophicus]PNH90789.1 siderophore ABC transporter ATP-binding protein [Vibrio diazotrophicus]PNH98523.1 siderophore ABC transporter ATP-binding protein [Vibrio diazotrophicus]PNI05648.1 siderophore ABC transporter ATP-binding protein [Vibrio diazotrophicus]
MIKLKNLTKMFGQQTVVNAASTQFEKGKVTSIIGPNGAGKSTLLSMASRLINRDAGEVWIDNRELVDWDTKALAKKLSVLRQANSLTMRFTVRELVSFGRFPYSKGKLTQDDQQVIDQSIEYLDLSDIEHKYLDELSGGQRQLAFIAMVIAQDTDYVFLDEPLNNLDIKHSLQIMSTIQRLAHELDKAVVVVIHDINFASCYSDRIIAMKKGEMVASGSVEEVIQAQVLSNIYETPFRVVEMEGKLMCLYHT